MPIESVVQSRLTSSAQLLARVPAARIRTEGEHVQMEPPYIVHGLTQERPLLSYGGPLSLRLIDYEIIVCARDLDEAYEISDLATAAVTQSSAGNTQIAFQSRTRQYDVDARLWVMTSQFTAAYQPH